MRGRLVLIGIALAVLSFAQLGHDDQAPTARSQSNAASSQCADQPAPERDVPPIITAALSTSATVQTHLVAGPRSQLRPALIVFSLSPHLPVAPPRTATPRFFPLLI